MAFGHRQLELSCPQIDPVLDEKLNDIDELIQSKLGFAPLTVGTDGPFTERTDTNDLCCRLPTGELWDGSRSWNNPENRDVKITTRPELSNKVFEVELEVQIMDLKDVYNKKTKKTLEGLQYPLEDSKITVMVQASDEITSVRAYTQRCIEAAIKTHDTIGPVELEVNTQESDARRRVVIVDLGSVYKTEDGHPVYWLEKADVMQRNQWELIIAVEFSSGLTGHVTTRPFRVTTKAGYKMRRKGRGSCADSSKPEVQRLFRKISGCTNHSMTDHDNCGKHKSLPNSGITKEFPDHTSAMSREFKDFSLMEEEDSATQPLPAENSGYNSKSKCVLPAEERIVFQRNTVLDRHTVTIHYSRDERINCVVEQPDLPGLLKLVGKQSKQLVSPPRKANERKDSEEDFWWACGQCFFERRKKSTIKDHVIHQVCQKTITSKTKGKVARRRLKRHLSCDIEEERFQNYSWKDSLSV